MSATEAQEACDTGCHRCGSCVVGLLAEGALPSTPTWVVSFMRVARGAMQVVGVVILAIGGITLAIAAVYFVGMNLHVIFEVAVIVLALLAVLAVLAMFR